MRLCALCEELRGSRLESFSNCIRVVALGLCRIAQPLAPSALKRVQLFGTTLKQICKIPDLAAHCRAFDRQAACLEVLCKCALVAEVFGKGAQLDGPGRNGCEKIQSVELSVTDELAASLRHGAQDEE